MLCRMKRDPNSSDSGARAGLHHAGEEHASPTPLLLHTHTHRSTRTPLAWLLLPFVHNWSWLWMAKMRTEVLATEEPGEIGPSFK